MPIINIHEKDETTSRIINDVTDIPLIISKCEYAGDDKFGGLPTLFTTLSEFKAVYPICENAAEHQNMKDPAYIMACELLNKGMPVYFVDNAFFASQYGPIYGIHNIDMISSDTFEIDDLSFDENVSYNVDKVTITQEEDGRIKVSASRHSDPVEDDFKTATIPFINDSSFNIAVCVPEDTDYIKYEVTGDADILNVNINLPGTLKAGEKFSFYINGIISYNNYPDPTNNLIKDYVSVIDTSARISMIQNAKEVLVTAPVDDIKDFVCDKNEVTIKYIAIPELTVSNPYNDDSWVDYANICADRGDCTYLLDVVKDFDYKTITNNITIQSNDIQGKLTTYSSASNAACFAPWHSYRLSTEIVDTDGNKIKDAYLPGSFGYLNTVANNMYKVNNWLAVAGISRGAIPQIGAASVEANRVITNTVAEKLQPKSAPDNGATFAINPITDIKPYGRVIWGNRTLKLIETEELLATHFLNTRNMISDIKKVAYNTAKTLMFDQIDEVLWLNFVTGMSPILEKLKLGSGIADYKLIKLDGAKRGQLKAKIKIYPLYAVEDFDIYVTASDTTDVAVE